MSEAAQSILAAIKTLPEDERAKLIDLLLEDEGPPDNDAGMSEVELQAEMRRRCEDPEPRIPADEVHRILTEVINAIPKR